MSGSGGDTVQTIGSDKVHTFTTVGTQNFIVSSTLVAQVLMVAGGGGGGQSVNVSQGSGGGGAGGLVYFSNLTMTPGTYTVTVGAGGGIGAAGANNYGTNGGDTTLLIGGKTVLAVAIGGGAGGPHDLGARSGGSGGGAGGSSSLQTAGASTQTKSFPGGGTGYGNSGGVNSTASPFAGGGGGGAGAVGFPSSSVGGGQGGIGTSFIISGTWTYYAGGGGGGSPSGLGGLGGGGAGGTSSVSATAGTNGTGGGGGGAGSTTASAAVGGSGILIIRYSTVNATLAGSNITITGNCSVATTISAPLFQVNAFSIVQYSTTGYPFLVSSIFTGGYTVHSGFIAFDGTVRVCGRNDSGQLGVNDLNTRSTVVSVLGISSQAIAIACGYAHTAILLNNGTVRVCGLNNNGQLGQNDLVTRSTVVSVLGISSQAIAVACGTYHTTILLNDGTVRVCGVNNFGQLGTNDLVTRSTVVSVLGISSQAIAVACGQSFTAILLNDGTVRVCGRNQNGQLGQNDLNNRSTVVSVLGISSQAIAIACGVNHIAILLNDGTVRVCGLNSSGQLGQNDLVTRSTVVSVLGISSQAVSVACGQSHTAILLNDGTVRMCGRNAEGQLGVNDTNNRSTVVSVLGISSQAIAVACGQYHTAMLLNDGTVRVCGLNSTGQLGTNDLNARSTVVSLVSITTPVLSFTGLYSGGSLSSVTALVMSDGTVRVCGLNSTGQLGTNDLVTRSTVVSVLGISSQAVSVACGQGHTAILLNDGTVRMCGRNAEGQLGQNDVVTRSTVVWVLGITQATSVASGRYHTAILLNDGTVRVCGLNNNGQLGTNDLVTRSTVVSVLGISSQAIAIACGYAHTAILLNNGTVRVCGLNNNGQLGQNDLVTRSTVVSVLGISSQAIAIACGTYHTAILLNDGTVRVCGRNAEGQLGQNDVVTRSTVVSVLGISSQAIAIACGGNYTAILLNDGTVRVCGRNNAGQLGVNDLNNRSTVVSVLGISSQAIAVACGQYHTAMLLNDGTVRTCGQNQFGQLDTNDLVTRSTVVSVIVFPPVLPWCTSLGAQNGQNHLLTLMSDGTVRGCGINNQGQLGTNDFVFRSTFAPIPGISSQAIAISSGQYCTAILLNDGTVRMCGRNSDGQLGVNDVTNRLTVISVLGISSRAIAIACGSYLTAILLNDGTVRACGRNNYGQLGVNDLNSRSTIVPVLGISSQAIAVAGGRYHTAILLNNGTVRVCGRNNFGQLGLNDLTTRATVVSVLGISSQAIAVACGYGHTAILLNNGTVRVCGQNNFGQLGQNDVVTRSTVVSVLGISSQAVAIACGFYHTTILLNDGTVRVCGRNQLGQLGVNDTNNRSTVVSVLGIMSQAVGIADGYYCTAILLNDGTVRVCGQNQFGQLGQNDTLTRLTVVPILGISGVGAVATSGTLLFGNSTVGIGANGLGLGISPTVYQLDLSTDNARKLTSTTWITGSDERIKSDIQTANLVRCSEIIDTLDLKYFEWNPEIQTSDRHSLGWIAQDVEQIFPRSVKQTQDYGFDDFRNLNTDQIIKAMYGSLKHMIQMTYPPTVVVDASNTQASNSLTSAPDLSNPGTG